VTAPDNNYTVCAPEKSRLEEERDGLRAAVAAGRGTILDLRAHLADLRAAQDFLRLSWEAADAQARSLREQLAAIHSEQSALENSILAERKWLLGVQQTQSERLHLLEPLVQGVAALTEERNALVNRVESLDRLVRTLRWENGPRSLKVVLPLARLLRRMSGG
jgi:chromosome segregation ATPase